MNPEFAFRLASESKSKPYEVSIYGDGEHEYKGYFMVVLDGFDEHDHPTGDRKRLYVKAESESVAREFIDHIINNDLVETFEDNEKLHIRKVWECISKLN